jgi:hypothetical protein
VFTNDLLAFQHCRCRLAGPLRHVRAFRPLGLLRTLRPLPRRQPTTGLSQQPEWIPGSGNDAGWFPCSLQTDRSAWHPALPRQHRHGYAAGLHRGLPTARQAGYGVDPPVGGRALHPGPYPPDLSRCHAYGALPLVPLVYRPISLAGPDPSGSARPSRLCQRCLPPIPGVSRIGLRSAPTRLLRQPGEEDSHLLRSPAPHGAQAPRGAPRPRTSDHQPNAVLAGRRR